MSIYLDASVLVSLFLSDAFSKTADDLLRSLREPLVVSDFGAAEFASGVSSHVRSRRITRKHAQAVYSDFDEWTLRDTTSLKIASEDVLIAAGYIRNLDSALRTPDAIHIAIARRVGSRLLTFDRPMALAARTLGVDVIKV